MLKEKRKVVLYCVAIILWVLLPIGVFSQHEPGETLHPISNILPDSIKNDSLVILNDTILRTNLRDSISPNALKSKVEYTATDSIMLNIIEKKAYLYGNVIIKYEDIVLKAAYVEMDFDESTLYATELIDSTGKAYGKPDFTDGSNSFTAKKIKYNFDTKKGFVWDIFTNMGDSYLQGSQVKRFKDNTANIRKGFYTTCELDHPHYAIKFGKARMIPDDKIVTGPAYVEIEDVPTPLALPFGYFPTKRGQISGIILPTWGESVQRGFYFEKFGYYIGISDYLDLTLQGDISTRGSWAAYASSNYKKRYRYDGSVQLSYAMNNVGEKFDTNFARKNDFKIFWSHRQDPKARPNSSFSANVNIMSNSFSKYNPTTTGEYLSNTFGSSIAYQTSLFRGRTNLSLNVSALQNVNTREIEVKLPVINYSVNTFYPFRKKKKTGTLKWYDNISMGYVMDLENSVSTYDSIILTPRVWDLMQNGMRHSIPIRSTVKLFKFFTWTNAVNFSDRWYLQSIEKNWVNDSDTSYIRSDTNRSFQMAHELSASSEITTKIYGMYSFKKGAIKAFRHVMTPAISFTFHPNFGAYEWGYYRNLQIDSVGNYRRYSVFENNIYGSPPDGLSGKVNFSLTNNLEMKVRNRKDSVSGEKKIMLLDYLRISTAYDIARDSLNWDPLRVSAHTRLFNLLDINFNGAWDFYATNTIGRINKYIWEESRQWLRRDNTQWNLSLSYFLSDRTFEKKNKEKEKKSSFFLTAWSVNVNVSYALSHTFNYKQQKFIPDTTLTVGVNGDFFITPKWKVGFYTGYDFIGKQFAYTSFNIYRDLHCWEMMIDWVPYGPRKSYNFTIRIKSSILKDVKITRKSDWRDNY